ncbi:MAG: hypothetical protein KatS3mg082_3136 [Nitrospiraceae bacterium]|nr:MAG: hypothetical protein KatS3mg082_3136 [Nitrospiraceae bacterium]
MSRPTSTRDLRASERVFAAAMSTLRFGRFEYLRIDRGELVLDPWPTAVRAVKLGSQDPGAAKIPPVEFELKPQVAELFEYIRAVDTGEIRMLEVKHGLPFSMEIEIAGGRRYA